MAVYEYENRVSGEKREIVASMKSPPPLRIRFGENGDWAPAPDGDDRGVWFRVWQFSGVVVAHAAGAVRYGDKGPPVSRTLPPNDAPIARKEKVGDAVVNIHTDGTRSDQSKRRIIANRKDSDAHCRALNLERTS